MSINNIFIENEDEAPQADAVTLRGIAAMEPLRQALERDVQEFLARGGVIQQLETRTGVDVRTDEYNYNRRGSSVR